MDKHEAVEQVVIPQLNYDMLPEPWVAGTVVPHDTPPEDMTDAEYIQYCYDNWMPLWAIKKEIYLRKPPVLSGIEPATAEIGAPSFDLKVSGTGLIQDSIIVFAGQDEPTQLNEDGTVSTGVNMGFWHGPDTIQVCVRNGSQISEPLEFTFTAAPEAGTEARRGVVHSAAASPAPKKLTRAQLNEMTKDELVEYAEDHDIEVTHSWLKEEIIDAIVRHRY